MPPIPDDPPPHEGAMIDFPLVVEPPDLVLIEVLESLPGRPLSGERLVRPDGTINLGFYGVIHVRGMTLAQIKVAIIKHLRRYIDDDTLGLRVDPTDDDQSANSGSPTGRKSVRAESDREAKNRRPHPLPTRSRPARGSSLPMIRTASSSISRPTFRRITMSRATS